MDGGGWALVSIPRALPPPNAENNNIKQSEKRREAKDKRGGGGVECVSEQPNLFEPTVVPVQDKSTSIPAKNCGAIFGTRLSNAINSATAATGASMSRLAYAAHGLQCESGSGCASVVVTVCVEPEADADVTVVVICVVGKF